MAKQNSRIGKTTYKGRRHRSVLPYQLKSISQTRKDIQHYVRAKTMMQNAEQPTNYPLQLLMNDVMLDALLTSQIENRKEQTFSASFTVKTAADKDDDEATKRLKHMPAFRKIIDEILDSIFRGYSMVELHIDSQGQLQVTELPRTNIIPQLGIFYSDYIEQTNPIYYRELTEYGTHILEFNNLIMHEQDFGLLNKAIPHVLMKRFTQSCWGELTEIFGMPIRTLKTDTQDPAMLSRGERMMEAMGAAAYAIIDTEEEMSFATSTSTSGDIYSNFINQCNNENSLLISGAIIGQDTKYGSRNKDEAAQQMLWEKVQSDMRFVEQQINTIVMPALARHGIVQEGSYINFSEAEDVNKLWQFTKEILPYKDVPNDWIKEKFGVEVLDKAKNPATEEKLGAHIPSSFFD